MHVYARFSAFYEIELKAPNLKLDNMSCVVYSCLRDWCVERLLPTVGLPMLNYRLDCQRPCDSFARKIDRRDRRWPN